MGLKIRGNQGSSEKAGETFSPVEGAEGGAMGSRREKKREKKGRWKVLWEKKDEEVNLAMREERREFPRGGRVENEWIPE